MVKFLDLLFKSQFLGKTMKCEREYLIYKPHKNHEKSAEIFILMIVNRSMN